MNSDSGGALEIGIECGVDAIALALEIVLREFFEQMILDHVNEVGGGAAFDAAAYKFQRRFFRGSDLVGGGVRVFDHLGEDAVAGFDGAIHVPFGGGVVIRSANDAAEESGFAEGELADVFTEVGLGSLSEAANREAAAIAEIDFVGIELKNLLFGEAVIDFDRHQHFFYFAAPFAFGGKEKAAGNLHVNRAGALGFLADAQVRHSGAENANPVETTVLEKAFVFGGDNGIGENLW